MHLMLVSMSAVLVLASGVALAEIMNDDNRDNLLRGTATTDQIRGMASTIESKAKEAAT
jgi:hypothetical protein